ncbi:cytochrome P-450 cyp509A1 [Cunninghamella echinulata]|nr:cytochrome P-450 cyp509A1 [Cunninghamella echinulata]
MSSQVLSAINQYIDLSSWTNNQDWYHFYEKYLLKYTNSKTKRITIGTSVALLVLGYGFKRLITPPKKLRHIPYISVFTTINNFVIKRLHLKALHAAESKALVEKNNGFYLKLERTGWVIHCSSPEAVKQILLKGDTFPKYDFNTSTNEDGSFFQEFVGFDNILLADGSEWKKHRKIANPAFHRSLPVKLFGDCTKDLFKLWDMKFANKPFDIDIHNITERLTLQIIGKAAFDFDFNSVLDEQSIWKKNYDDINKAAAEPLFILFPTLERKYLWLFPKRQESFRKLREWKKMLISIIEKKREVLKENHDHGIEEAEKDLLTLMIESENRGEGALTNEELLQDLNIFFIAGHDTTAFSLSASIYYLAKHQDIQQRAREEAISVLCPNGEIDEDIFPDIEDTKKYVYINQIIKETLRINGSVLFLLSPRLVAEDVNLNGTFIPKGSQVNVNIYDTHHSSNVWNDPESYNPDRWSPGGEAEQLAGKGMAWVPFSNGSRQCIGMNFSLLEQRVILSTLLRKYEWSLPEDSIHKDYLVNKYNLIPKPIDLKIRFKRRY